MESALIKYFWKARYTAMSGMLERNAPVMTTGKLVAPCVEFKRLMSGCRVITSGRVR